MVLSDPAKKWSGKCIVHGLMDMIPRTKTKTLPLRKLKACYFFHAVYYSKNHVIPHPVIAAILNVILNILQRWKTTITSCQILQIQMKTIRYSYLLRIWFQVEFCFKWRPSWTPSSLV